MKEEQRYAIRDNLTILVNDLRISDVRAKLIERRVFSTDDFERFEHEKTQKNKTLMLLEELINTHNPKAYDAFLTALDDEEKYDWLAAKIRQTEESTRRGNRKLLRGKAIERPVTIYVPVQETQNAKETDKVVSKLQNGAIAHQEKQNGSLVYAQTPKSNDTYQGNKCQEKQTNPQFDSNNIYGAARRDDDDEEAKDTPCSLNTLPMTMRPLSIERVQRQAPTDLDMVDGATCKTIRSESIDPGHLVSTPRKKSGGRLSSRQKRLPLSPHIVNNQSDVTQDHYIFANTDRESGFGFSIDSTHFNGTHALKVTDIDSNSLLGNELRLGDIITAINGCPSRNLAVTQAEACIRDTDTQLVLQLKRKGTFITYEKKVVVTKQSSSDEFGFKFLSGEERPRFYGDKELWITRIVNPLVDELEVGDVIKEVDENSTHGMSYQQVKEFIREKQTKENPHTLTLKIHRTVYTE